MPKPQTRSKLAALIVGPQRVPPIAHTTPTVGIVSEPDTTPTVCTIPTVGKDARSKPGIPRLQRIAQDGHSTVEQAIYLAMWTAAKPAGSDDWRVIEIGYRGLAALTRMDWTTIKRNLRRLVEKLSIEDLGGHNPDTRTPNTYRVYSYRAILERRHTAGLDWVVKNRGGVTLHTTPTVCTNPTVGAEPTVGSEPTGTLGTEHIDPVGTVPTPLGNEENREGNCPRCRDTGRTGDPHTGPLCDCPTGRAIRGRLFRR